MISLKEEEKNMEVERKQFEQKEIVPKSGMAALILISISLLVSIGICTIGGILLGNRNYVAGGILLAIGIILICILPIFYAGLKVVGPNEALVLTLFGNYYGTILKQGFYYVNPFVSFNNPIYYREREQAKAMARERVKSGHMESVPINAKKTVSLKNMTLNNGIQKVNDVLGNPVIIGAVVIWKVKNPTKAVFNVEDYVEFLSIQTDSTIRNIARKYPYDLIDVEDEQCETEKTLRGSAQEIAESMKEELSKRVDFAGLEVEEVRITHLSYAEEIAAAMLQRQQATAVIAAKQKIVDGAVSMVKMAIDKLGDEEIVVLDEERKAAMVSNLLVVLCSGKDTQPVINNGSIY